MIPVSVEIKNFSDYLQFVDDNYMEKFISLTQHLKGARVAMINATSFGGGVAEKLHSVVPLLQSLGLKVDWWVMQGEDSFYNVTKTFHNRLQGEEGELSIGDQQIYLEFNRKNASFMENWSYDFVVVHDPQPAALIEFRKPKPNEKWLWRCHIDTSTPNMDCLNFLSPFILQYDAGIFTMKEYVSKQLPIKNLSIIPPSIDPLSPKNIPIDEDVTKDIINRFGVDANRPLISQISRFDSWKDPLGVIDVYRIVKKELPEVQLSLVGSMASDDPEGWDYLYRTLRKAGDDYDITIITNFNGISHYEVNAFQRASQVILQKSLKEGFGLTVAEGLWKGTPVIGGNVGGIRLQIEDGITGYLVSTVEECAELTLKLLRNPALALEMVEKGKEKVRKQFLVTSNILSYLQLFYQLSRC